MTIKPVLQYRIAKPFAQAEAAVRDALKSQGFGILTEVDVAATFKEKLGIDTPPHLLLGACNPKLAHASLEAAPSVGAFLPCGVALRQGTSEAETIVAMQNPALLAETFGIPALEEPSREALTRLTAALASVGEAI